MRHTIAYLLAAALVLPLVARGAEEELVVQTMGTDYSLKSAVSSDGVLMATGGSDRTLRIWHLPAGRILRIVHGHEGSIDGLAFSPDRKTLVSIDGGNNSRLRWTDVTTGRELAAAPSQGAQGVAYSPDGKTVVTSGCRQITFWDAEKRTERSKVKYDCGTHPTQLYFTSDGRYLVGSTGRVVTVLDAKSGALLKRLKSTESSNLTKGYIALSPDHTSVAIIWGSSGVIVDLNALEAEPTDIGLRPGDFSGGPLAWLDRNTLVAFFGQQRRAWDLAQKKARDLEVGAGTRELPPSEGWVVSRSESGRQFVIWKAATGEEVRRFDIADANNMIRPWFRPGTHAFTAGEGPVRLFDLEYGLGQRIVSDAARGGNWSADGKQHLSLTKVPHYMNHKSVDVHLWDGDVDHPPRELTLAWPKAFPMLDTNPPMLSPDGTQIAGVTNAGVALWDAKTGALLRELKNPSDESVVSIAFVPGSPRLAALSLKKGYKGLFFVWDTTTGEVIDQLPLSTQPRSSLSVSRDGRYAAWDNRSVAHVRDLNTKAMRGASCALYCTGAAISPDSKWFVVTEPSGRYRFFNLEETKSFATPVRTAQWPAFRDPVFSDDGKYLLAQADSSMLMLWNLQNDERVFLVFADEDWIAVTPDGYFDGSRDGGRLLAIVRETTPFGVDQFTVARNRPDILLERLQFGHPDLRAHYKRQYLKRLRKLGLSEEKLTAELVAPEASILSGTQDGKFVKLKAKCVDQRFPLQRYSIYVNDVPLQGAQGVSISGSSHEINERVELTTGENKIEVSCSNTAGAESFRALTTARYEPQTPRDLYYLGFGVSKYKVPGLDLSYAHKDAADLARLFSGKREGFRQVYSKTFLNEQVTARSIAEAKSFLAKARPDDVFVLFIAGHGVHDRDAESTYYFLTHDADPDNLTSTAANFELIEGLLQGVAPRQKLFLMDTCESGERDEELPRVAAAGKTPARARGIRIKREGGASVTPAPRIYLQDRERFIYNDLVRRSGAIVFSSSRGGELSYEDDSLKNGYFTSEIIKALSSSVADTNADQQVSTEELRSYVARAVSERTKGLQNPTVDRDNLTLKITMPVGASAPDTEEKARPKKGKKR